MPDGIVTDISDWDGDVDDYGRSVSIHPRVYVRWPGEDEDESFTASIVSYGNFYPTCYDADEIELMCEDLRVIRREYSHERGPYRIPYGGYTRHISPEGFAMMPEPKPIWRKLSEPEYLLNPERPGFRKVSY
jgi:hypothetical protein